MAAISETRGHEIIFTDEWVYADNGRPITEDRPCVRCGKYPTKSGHDPCLGEISGVSTACCGHGLNDGFFVFE